MKDTVLWGLLLVCLLVGHTHDDIDRMFSRIKVALAGHDYFTVIEMLNLMTAGLPGFDLKTAHLSKVWAWKDMKALGSLPPITCIHCESDLRSLSRISLWRSVIAFSYFTVAICDRFLTWRAVHTRTNKHDPITWRPLS